MENIVSHTFFLCNKDKEPSRYESIMKQIDDISLTNYSILSHTWGTDITPEIREKYCKTDTCMRYICREMISRPLANTEISLFLNHIECLRNIRDQYTSGNFVIFESDVLFFDGYSEKITKVLELASQHNDIDIINIGKGNGELPHSEAIRDEIWIYKEPTNKYTEGIIWTYRGVCTFLSHFEKTCDINGPIDNVIEVYSKYFNQLTIYWSHPSLVHQGSICGTWNSTIR